MRDIKFRAWDTWQNKYLQDENNLLINPFSGEQTTVEMGEIYGNTDQYILEQYTGLKDKNGVEIYENDVVRMHVIVLSPDDKIGVVKYSPQYGYSLHFTSGRMARQEYWATGDKHKIEVIGNIHENEDLLEKQ